MKQRQTGPSSRRLHKRQQRRHRGSSHHGSWQDVSESVVSTRQSGQFPNSENLLFLDGKRWAGLLAEGNFELDYMFVEPVRHDAYAPKLLGKTSSRHPKGSSGGGHSTSGHRDSIRSSLTDYRLTTSNGMLLSPDLPKSSPRRPPPIQSRDSAVNSPIPASIPQNSSVAKDMQQWESDSNSNSTTWDAKKFKHRHKRVQFQDEQSSVMTMKL